MRESIEYPFVINRRYDLSCYFKVDYLTKELIFLFFALGVLTVIALEQDKFLFVGLIIGMFGIIGIFFLIKCFSRKCIICSDYGDKVGVIKFKKRVSQQEGTYYEYKQGIFLGCQGEKETWRGNLYP